MEERVQPDWGSSFSVRQSTHVCLLEVHYIAEMHFISAARDVISCTFLLCHLIHAFLAG